MGSQLGAMTHPDPAVSSEGDETQTGQLLGTRETPPNGGNGVGTGPCPTPSCEAKFGHSYRVASVELSLRIHPKFGHTCEAKRKIVNKKYAARLRVRQPVSATIVRQRFGGWVADCRLSEDTPRKQTMLRSGFVTGRSCPDPSII